MNTPNTPLESAKLTAWSVGIAGTFLLMALLVWAMYHYTRPEPLGADRAQERRQFLQEIREAEAQAVQNYAWQDQSKGLVRLPIDRALELSLQEWQNPDAARAKLIELSEKAAEEPPPPPEPENPYE
jgi:hypothetical protein